MKTIGILATGLILMIGTLNITYAATKCVALDASSTCTGAPTAGKIDWSATCNSIPITGVGVCSSTAGSSFGQAADTLEAENMIDANKYCWCKMTSPALSRFVFTRSYETTAGCTNACAHDCVLYAVNVAAFRAGLFSNLQ